MWLLRLGKEENLRRQIGQRRWRSVEGMPARYFFVALFCRAVLLGEFLSQIVQRLILAVAIANNASAREAGGVQRIQFESEGGHRS